MTKDEYAKLDPEHIVKTVKASVIARVKYSTDLLAIDYAESDGTDAGAIISFLNEEGMNDFDEIEIVSVEKVE